MFVDLVSKPRTLARAALTVAYLGLMVIMTVVAWQGAKVDLSSVGQVSSALAAALLGAAINPGGARKSAQGVSTAPVAPVAPTEPVAPVASGWGKAGADASWGIQAVVGCAALLVTALALVVDGSGHSNAPAAFVAVAAAFSALFLDTSSVTHPLTDTPAPAGAAASTGRAVAQPVGAGTAVREAAADETPAADPPASGGPAAAASGEAAGAAQNGGRATGGDPTPKAQIPAQSTGSADDAESPNS
ncbi:hypothetical protein [Streptacidiphilus anmyonensis]|uniref:hypothetical protein n=1 Tax=Streptacidiphilus anmyonensis TaxID=405782 RepID=UPI0005AB81F1|nr:hypothetical protein [Streptacidiphilus anmyonensis]